MVLLRDFLVVGLTGPGLVCVVAFKVYDEDNDGNISNGDLFNVLKMMVCPKDQLTTTAILRQENTEEICAGGALSDGSIVDEN